MIRGRGKQPLLFLFDLCQNRIRKKKRQILIRKKTGSCLRSAGNDFKLSVNLRDTSEHMSFR